MTTGGLFRAAFDAASSSTGAGLATPENVSPPTHSVVTVSALLLLALPRSCTLAVGRGAGAAQPPRCLVTKLPPTDPSHPCWGGYLFSSRVSVACGQQLDWRGVRHTRELCGDADPSGHLRESYTPSTSIKSTSDLDRLHMPWDYLEQHNSMSPL